MNDYVARYRTVMERMIIEHVRVLGCETKHQNDIVELVCKRNINTHMINIKS